MSKIITVEKPWGSFERFTLNERTTVKLIYLKAHHRLSYQYHLERSEFCKIVKGKVLVILNGRKRTLSQGYAIRIPLRAKHRLYGLTSAIILEISYGKFDENDIVRLADDYNRI